jgi:catechol 2,3-dioxygenase-like lactoylglutathione lyase family enzyme
MAQLGYITLGTNQLARAIAFYDVLLGSLGATRFLTGAHGVSWSFGPGSTSLSVLEPFDGKAATVGSGVMVAIGLASREQVAAAHARALELGAADEGGPGRRGDAGFFGAYVRDLDGNKLALFCIERPADAS